ncbi:Serine/threonine-protein kinase TOUSLED [Galdieria sulphuraria]|nr:Serine/threonine-protein kinase TOUSLED [Galdieria sulphuraria]
MKGWFDDPYKQQLLEQRIAPSHGAKKRKPAEQTDAMLRNNRLATSENNRRNRSFSSCPFNEVACNKDSNGSYKQQPSRSKESDSNSSCDIQMYFKPFQENLQRDSTSPVTPNHEEESWSFSSIENDEHQLVTRKIDEDHERQQTSLVVAELINEIQQYKQCMKEKDNKISQLETYLSRSKDFIRQLILESETKKRIESKKWLDEQSMRLGRLMLTRQGTGIKEYWEPGSCFRETERRLEALRERMEVLDAEFIENRDNENSNSSSCRFIGQENEAILARRRSILLEEEKQLLLERRTLENERLSMMQELRRQREESASRFSNFIVLSHQYLLVKLVGKGGFSEVFKAFDLNEFRWVACKIHQLNHYWTEEQKSNYIRHTTREYEIHKTLEHPRVVKLYDVFEIDENSFCTVLEYCDGSDLDTYLKAKGSLEENEAKLIICQVLSGLLYLNNQPKKIIHYDLKPANILFKDGKVRIADFGLCKVIDAVGDRNETTELTSQGAGTYWYLPPECFASDDDVPQICPKVDIWSVGVILYQMLYGKKPFGHGLSQQQLVQQGLVHGCPLVFPDHPNISEQGKNFIRRCLTCRVDLRLDVHQAAFHEYLRS